MVHKKAYKKLFILLFAVSMIFELIVLRPLYAEAALVSGSNISIGAVKSTAVSINITDNPGLMGFKISVTYPSNILTVSSVERGTLTKTGSFASNYEKEGQIVVVWNNTEEISADGSLFDIILDVKDQTKSGTILLSFSEEDTFNGEYESVPLVLNPISVTGKEPDYTSSENGNKPDESSDTVSPAEKNDDIYSDDYKLISDIIEDYDTETLSETEKQEIVDRINSAFRSQGREEQFSDYEQAMLFYNMLTPKENKHQIKDNYSNEEVRKAAEEALAAAGAYTFSELNSSDKTIFADEIKSLLPKAEIDDLNSDEIVELIDEIISESAGSEKSESPKAPSLILIVVLSIAVIALAAVFIYIIFILRGEKNEKHKKSI